MSVESTPLTVDDLYQRAAGIPSDVSEHVPTLMRLGRMVDHITEFGTRRGLSTAALLKADPTRLNAYDIERLPEVDALEAAARQAGIDFSFRLENVLLTTIEPTDLLFIDTLHTYDQLRAELDRHAPKVRTFIALHDTTTFGGPGELPGSIGLWPAIQEFINTHPEWKLIDRWTNNNGFSLLMRKPPPATLPPTADDSSPSKD